MVSTCSTSGANLQQSPYYKIPSARSDKKNINLRVLEEIERASRLQDTSLETSERKGLEEVVANLTKQILDLQSRLNEL